MMEDASIAAKSARSGRVFIALWPSPAVAARIVRETEALVARSGGRGIGSADLHLTLAFLGEIEPEQLRAAETALHATSHAAFDLALERIGCFRRAQVLWLAPQAPPGALVDVHALLWAHLAGAGFTPERRSFKAHVTLARRSRAVRTRRLAAPIAWHVDSLVLATSSQERAGPRYRQLAVQALAPRGAA